MIALVIILFLAVVGLSYFVWNLLRKVERYEEDIQLKDEFIIKFKSMVEESNEKMRKLDEKGAFESEDETGFIFKGLRDIALVSIAIFKIILLQKKKHQQQNKLRKI